MPLRARAFFDNGTTPKASHIAKPVSFARSTRAGVTVARAVFGINLDRINNQIELIGGVDFARYAP